MRARAAAGRDEAERPEGLGRGDKRVDDDVRTLCHARDTLGVRGVPLDDDHALVVRPHGFRAARHTDDVVAAIERLARDALRYLSAGAEERELHGVSVRRRASIASSRIQAGADQRDRYRHAEIAEHVLDALGCRESVFAVHENHRAEHVAREKEGEDAGEDAEEERDAAAEFHEGDERSRDRRKGNAHLPEHARDSAQSEHEYFLVAVNDKNRCEHESKHEHGAIDVFLGGCGVHAHGLTGGSGEGTARG